MILVSLHLYLTTWKCANQSLSYLHFQISVRSQPPLEEFFLAGIRDGHQLHHSFFQYQQKHLKNPMIITMFLHSLACTAACGARRIRKKPLWQQGPWWWPASDHNQQHRSLQLEASDFSCSPTVQLSNPEREEAWGVFHHAVYLSAVAQIKTNQTALLLCLKKNPTETWC